MSNTRITCMFLLVVLSCTGLAQASDRNVMRTKSATEFRVSGVSIQQDSFAGKQAFKVTMPRESYQDPQKELLTDRPNLAWIPLDFHDGVIECDVAARLDKEAPSYARGFIGIGFRIDADLHFEAIYLRPANGRVDDQIRRNHTVQYFALPDHDFARLRRESPEKYESYADIGLGEWIHMKIEVNQNRARLYVNGAKQPVLVVNDLKLGPDQRGGVGFWIESGTVGYFTNFKVMIQ